MTATPSDNQLHTVLELIDEGLSAAEMRDRGVDLYATFARLDRWLLGTLEYAVEQGLVDEATATLTDKGRHVFSST